MEMHAYDEMYLRHARKAFANMLNYAVYALGYSLCDFYQLFLKSYISEKFARGDCDVIAGKSGTELALLVSGQEYREILLSDYRSPEYWTGWALAYYQWERNMSFQEIEEVVSIDDICLMYHPYHEMDVESFVERMDAYYKAFYPETKLKRMRKKRNLTQKELADYSKIPLRTIQQYEQRQKDINMAHAISIISLAKVLECNAEDLLEKI